MDCYTGGPKIGLEDLEMRVPMDLQVPNWQEIPGVLGLCLQKARGSFGKVDPLISASPNKNFFIDFFTFKEHDSRIRDKKVRKVRYFVSVMKSNQFIEC